MSFTQLAAFREFFGATSTTKLVAFDTFTSFPEANHELDKGPVSKFLNAAGSSCISARQLKSVLEFKGQSKNVDIVEGNCLKSIPEYVKEHPELRISLLSVDMDTYESTQIILEHFFSRVVPGGIVVFDDYSRVPGETLAVEEFFQKNPNLKFKLKKSPFCYASSYFVKE